MLIRRPLVEASLLRRYTLLQRSGRDASTSGRQMSMTFSRAIRYPILRAVLITFTPLKRVVAEPWLTAELCEGWPLPSLNAPKRR